MPNTAISPPDGDAPGKPLPWRVRAIAALLRSVYFGRVRIVGAQSQPAPRASARLIVASHRNGAIDGYTVLRAFPAASGLISVQLLKHPVLRWLIGGIAVVREKDRQRFGEARATIPDPIEAGCAHLRAGGDLIVFPEGSSEWGHRPLPYQRGAARIARALIDEGAQFEVVPVGLHYMWPDRFRSRAEVLVGAALNLPQRDAGEVDRAFELRLHAVISDALDAVSVNCPDAETFARVEAAARAEAARGGSYAQAFIASQANPPATRAEIPRARRWPWDGLAVAALFLLMAPILLAAWFAGRKADARNTVTLHRMIAGTLVALPWLPCLGVLAWHWPGPMAGWTLLAAWGWWRWPQFVHGEFA